jgi:hypothetical protein
VVLDRRSLASRKGCPYGEVKLYSTEEEATRMAVMLRFSPDVPAKMELTVVEKEV